jgi:hypothetical protein
MRRPHARSTPPLPRVVRGALLALMVAAGCGGEPQEQAFVYTMFDIREALRNDGHLYLGEALGPGLPATAILTEDTSTGEISLNVTPAFSEERPAAFVTTELWYGFEEVWVQPAYLQVESWSDSPAPIPGSKVLIDVGPDSKFYSPFWQFSYAVVGPQSDPDHYRSTRALFVDGAPLHAAGRRTCPARPLDFDPAPQGLVDPQWMTPLPPFGLPEAYLDGKRLGLIDLGPNSFAVKEGGVIEELPFFLFVAPHVPTGALGPVDAFRIAGVGPLWSGRPAEVAIDPVTGNPQLRFGAFWRVYFAILPPGASPFHISEQETARNNAVANGADPLEYEGRVAVNPQCFQDRAFPAGCYWLDSQAKVEGLLGSAGIVRTGITGTCPLVFFDKKPVQR